LAGIEINVLEASKKPIIADMMMALLAALNSVEISELSPGRKHLEAGGIQ